MPSTSATSAVVNPAKKRSSAMARLPLVEALEVLERLVHREHFRFLAESRVRGVAHGALSTFEAAAAHAAQDDGHCAGHTAAF